MTKDGQDDETKRKRNAGKRVRPTSAPRDAARAERSALACRRSTTALAVGALAPWAQLQARLPGTQRDVRFGKLAQPGAKTSRFDTGVTRARLSQSRDAPPGPVVMPASMMPEAARKQSVSLRARAPHSLRFREYPRPKASFTERDDGLICNNKGD